MHEHCSFYKKGAIGNWSFHSFFSLGTKENQTLTSPFDGQGPLKDAGSLHQNAVEVVAPVLGPSQIMLGKDL